MPYSYPNGVSVWVDWDHLVPGTPWKQAIQQAIHHGHFFIACFSKEYNTRDKTYMNEELSIAIENLRQKPVDRIWFIPVKLNECEIPDIKIGEGETLQDLQYVNLYEGWETGIQQILNFMPSKSSETINYAYKEGDNRVLFRSVNGQHYFIPFQEVRWDSKEISLTLSPTLSEQTSFLCSLRKGRHDVLALAHQEDAAWVSHGKLHNFQLKAKLYGKSFSLRIQQGKCISIGLNRYILNLLHWIKSQICARGESSLTEK